MNSLKRYGIIIGIVMVTLVLIVLRSSGNKFRPDAMRQAAASLDGSNLLTSAQAADLGGHGLLIILDNSDRYRDIPDAVRIEPVAVTEKKNIKIIRNNNGPVLLSSADPSVSARVWMVLSQMGVKNVYILSEAKDDETIKHEFRPGTVSQPEF